MTRQAAFHAIRLMSLLWEDGEFIAAGWALTMKDTAVAHAIPSFAIMGQYGDKPPMLVCGICAHQVLVHPGIDHIRVSLCEHNIFNLHPLVNEKYAFWRDQLRKLLHIGQPSQRVLDLAKAKMEIALAMLSLCPTAFEAAEVARSQAHFAQF